MPVYNRHFWAGVGNIDVVATLRTYGPVVPVEVAIPRPLAEFLANSNQTVPSPITGFALIDTGASITAVDQTVFQGLGVAPVSVTNVGTAHGPTQQFVYPARISFPGTTLKDLDFNQVLGCDLTGQSAGPTTERLIVLIGRDLLQWFMFVYNGPLGMITIAY